MTYMFILKCALKLVEEIILYYDARSKKQQNRDKVNTISQQVNLISKQIFVIDNAPAVKFRLSSN